LKVSWRHTRPKTSTFQWSFFEGYLQLKVFWQFEELVAKILKANGFSIDPDWPFGPERGFDLATIDNDRLAIEAKYYRTERAQPSLLDVAAERLSAGLEAEQLTKGMLVVSCVIDPAARLRLEERHSILVCGRSDLSVWGRRFPDLFEQLTDILESWNSPFDPNDGKELRELLQRPQTGRSAPKTPPELRGAQLCSELRSLKPGAKTWTSYEKLCETISSTYSQAISTVGTGKCEQKMVTLGRHCGDRLSLIHRQPHLCPPAHSRAAAVSTLSRIFI
jgi:hypothetical protein